MSSDRSKVSQGCGASGSYEWRLPTSGFFRSRRLGPSCSCAHPRRSDSALAGPLEQERKNCGAKADRSQQLLTQTGTRCAGVGHRHAAGPAASPRASRPAARPRGKRRYCPRSNRSSTAHPAPARRAAQGNPRGRAPARCRACARSQTHALPRAPACRRTRRADGRVADIGRLYARRAHGPWACRHAQSNRACHSGGGPSPAECPKTGRIGSRLTGPTQSTHTHHAGHP